MKKIIIFSVLFILFWVLDYYFIVEILRRVTPTEAVVISFEDIILYCFNSSPAMLLPLLAGLFYHKQGNLRFHILMGINVYIALMQAVILSRNVWLYQHPSKFYITSTSPEIVPLFNFFGVIAAFIGTMITIVLGISIQQQRLRRFVLQNKFEFEERAG
jgi:hypothetical protein